MTRTRPAARRGADNLGAMIESFTIHLDGEHKAARTVALYREAARDFERFIRASQCPTDVRAITSEHVSAYMASLSRRGWQPSTANQQYRSLQQFWKWLQAEGEITRSPMAALKPPAIPDKDMRVILPEEIAALLVACRGRRLVDQRDQALIALLYDAGLRLSELTNLTLTDVDVRTRRV